MSRAGVQGKRTRRVAFARRDLRECPFRSPRSMRTLDLNHASCTANALRRAESTEIASNSKEPSCHSLCFPLTQFESSCTGLPLITSTKHKLRDNCGSREVVQRSTSTPTRDLHWRLLHELPVVLHAVANSVRDWLGSPADQHVVGSWGGAGADTEQRIERGMPCSAPIEAEHELVEVVLEVGPPQSVVNAQAPALEI